MAAIVIYTLMKLRQPKLFVNCFNGGAAKRGTAFFLRGLFHLCVLNQPEMIRERVIKIYKGMVLFPG
jgi:hypothetical protein